MFNKPCRITTGEQTVIWRPDPDLTLTQSVADCLNHVRKLGVPITARDQFKLLPVTSDITHVLINDQKVAEILDIQNLRRPDAAFSQS